MINFIKRGLIQQKSQNAWVYVWNHENKSKRKGIKVVPALWEKNLAKIWLKTTKKSSVEPCQVGEREESLKKIWKSVLNESNTVLKKTWFTMFNWSKNKFDQSNQAEAYWNFSKWFQLIKNQIGSIDNLEKKHLFRKKPDFLKTCLKALNIRNKNAWEWDEMLFQNTSFKPNFPKI